MSSKSKKANKNKKENVQKIKVKGELASTLSIVIPVALVFVVLIGGFLLFIYLEEGRRLPDEKYLTAEKLVKSGELIGFNYDECSDIVGKYAIINEEGEWIFPMMGYKQYSDGGGIRSYEICVYNENGISTRAVLRQEEWE
jgi:hypothetical protein